MRILIVDDDRFYLETLAQMVRGWGFAAATAETGAEALEHATKAGFDLFLLDVFLPDMTAVELIPRVRGFQPAAHIVTITGQSSRELELELRRLGIAYYMAKPVQPSELKNLLDHMERSRLAPAASASKAGGLIFI